MIAWKEEAERVNFLTLLERDLATDMFFCSGCIILHSKRATSPINRRHRFGDCKTVRADLFSTRGLAVSWFRQCFVKQRNSTHIIFIYGKVINDQLVIKVDYMIHFVPPEFSPRFNICSHLKMGKYPKVMQPKDSDFENLLKCRSTHLGSSYQPCRICRPQTRRCEWCAVEYDFKFTKCSKSVQMRIEAWANLGSGQALDDPEWIATAANNTCTKARMCELGSVREMYETG